MPECYVLAGSSGGISADLSDPDNLERLFRTIPSQVDVLIGVDLPVTCAAGGVAGSRRYGTVLEYSLEFARRHGLLKNERTLFLTTEEVLIKITLILGRMQKEAYGFEDLMVSDVLDVFAKIKLARLHDDDPCDDGIAGKAAIEYLADLKAQNLVDSWSLVQILRKFKEEEEKQDGCVLVGGSGILGDRKLGEIELCQVLFGKKPPMQVAREFPLDASFNNSCSQSAADFTLLETCWSDIFQSVRSSSNDVTGLSSSQQHLSKDQKYTLQLLAGYFRLMINSRDEIALSRVVAGPGGILNHQAFNAIRKQARKSNAPMYQSMVSFVQKSRLGGKCESSSDHPFSSYKKELVDFCDVMDKAQTLVEDQKEQVAFLQKICQCFRSHVVKSCSSSKKRWKMTHLDSTITLIQESFEGRNNDILRESGVAKKGSMAAGQPNLKAMRDVIDKLSTTWTLNFKVDLHKMLGKVEDFENQSEFEKSVRHELSPSASYPSVISLFRSPEAETVTSSALKDDDGLMEEQSLAERLGVVGVEKAREIKKNLKKQQRRDSKGKPMFAATLAWAQETSPIVGFDSPVTPANEAAVEAVAEAVEASASPVLKDKKTATTKLKAKEEEEKEETDDHNLRLVLEDEPEEEQKITAGVKRRYMIDKARCEAELILEGNKKLKKPPKSGPAKRSILKDINKATKVPTLKVKASGDGEETKAISKKRHIAAGGENETSALDGGLACKQPEAKKAKTKAATSSRSKKALVPLKGQMKMTAFLRM